MRGSHLPAPCAAVETGQDIGSPAMLERDYEAPQKRVNSAMIAAMDGLKAVFQPQARGAGLAGGRGWWHGAAASEPATSWGRWLLPRSGAHPPCPAPPQPTPPMPAPVQSGPVAGLRSLGLDLVNSSPVAKQAIMRIAMHGLGEL